MAEFLRDSDLEFCDIILVLKNRPPLPAHKSILAARCSYFEGMFRSFAPPNNRINVSACSVSSIYQGTCDLGLFCLKCVIFNHSFPFSASTDPNRRNHSIQGVVRFVHAIHLLRRNANASRGLTVPVPCVWILW